jgi:hypothetical protein
MLNVGSGDVNAFVLTQGAADLCYHLMRRRIWGYVSGRQGSGFARGTRAPEQLDPPDPEPRRAEDDPERRARRLIQGRYPRELSFDEVEGGRDRSCPGCRPPWCPNRGSQMA